MIHHQKNAHLYRNITTNYFGRLVTQLLYCYYLFLIKWNSRIEDILFLGGSMIQYSIQRHTVYRTAKLLHGPFPTPNTCCSLIVDQYNSYLCASLHNTGAKRPNGFPFITPHFIHFQELFSLCSNHFLYLLFAFSDLFLPPGYSRCSERVLCSDVQKLDVGISGFH